jgi:hypothetical protein
MIAVRKYYELYSKGYDSSPSAREGTSLPLDPSRVKCKVKYVKDSIRYLWAELKKTALAK